MTEDNAHTKSPSGSSPNSPRYCVNKGRTVFKLRSMLPFRRRTELAKERDPPTTACTAGSRPSSKWRVKSRIWKASTSLGGSTSRYCEWGGGASEERERSQ